MTDAEARAETGWITAFPGSSGIVLVVCAVASVLTVLVAVGAGAGVGAAFRVNEGASPALRN